MKIKKKEHKSILQKCFLEETQTGIRQKSFPLDKLESAVSAYKKLVDSTKDKEFVDGEIEFTPAEVAILKEVFDKKGKTGFVPSVGREVFELKNLFEGKK